MRSIEIRLYYSLPGGTNRLTYKDGARTVDILRVLDKPNGYMYFNYKSRSIGEFTISKVVDRFGHDLDLAVQFPVEHVVNFFVYYSYHLDHPLMICIATMKNKGFVTYQYFTPTYKNSKKWILIPTLVSDPKWSPSFNWIKQKLDENFALMGGVEIHIDRIHVYRNDKIIIKPYPYSIEDYKIYTHELDDQRPFVLNRVRCNDEIIKDIEITGAVISVHVVFREDFLKGKPILLCIVEETKDPKESHVHKWYSLSSLNSDKWVERYTQRDLFVSSNIERELDILCELYHEFEININEDFFYSPGKNFSNNPELFADVYESNTGSYFSKHSCMVKSDMKFKVNTLSIYGRKQTGLPVDMFGGFHVFCHQRNDPYIPVIICAQVKENGYRWYRLEHFASSNWVEYTKLENFNPEDKEYIKEFDKIYDQLFWVNLEIDYDKIRKLEDYNKNDRYIGKRETQHYGFKKIEVVNYSSYPLHVKIFLDGKLQEGIGNIDDVDTVSIFYYDSEKKNIPLFVVFEMSKMYMTFRWFSRDTDYTNLWVENKDLKNKDPKTYTFHILKTVQDGISNYQLQEGEPEEETPVMQTVAAKAVGSSVGAVAFCGVGYLVYTNAGPILSLLR